MRCLIMDPNYKPPPIKNCPMCRLAMVAERTDSRLAEFNHFRCLGCDLTITFTPAAGRSQDK
jgi:transposase-like protein